MSFNDAVARQFERMSVMLELLDADRFRVNAYARAARTIGGLSRDLEPIAGDLKELQGLDGIGKSTADKIAEFANTGRIAEHEELAAKVPATLMDLLEIQGLGPKTVRLLWKDQGVETIDQLKAAIEDGSILELPRMGTKTVENIRQAIAFNESSGGRLHLGVAMPIAERIVEYMRGAEGIERVAFAGSLRRGRETIGDIDVLVVASDASRAHEAFREMPGVEQVLASGESKTSVRCSLAADAGRWGDADTNPSVQADLRVVPGESWGAALMYFTGSKEHNVRLREIALRKKLTLNEYGLFPEDDEKDPPQRRGVRAVAGKTEEEVYKKLGVAFVPPELREDRGELSGEIPDDLIEPADIKAELHAHTTASDGLLSLEQLVEGARQRGFHTIAVTDHSRSAIQANGLSVERLRAQIEQVHAFNKSAKDITVLAGSEVDILADGSLDYDDDLLAELDMIVASPHAALSQDPRAATRRLIRAIEHPLVRVLGHPTGRLINRRPGLEPAMDEIIAAAKEHDVALEINAHWMRLDLRDRHVRAAVEGGALLAIDCDVHAREDFDNLRYGVLTGRRGWLPRDRCINTWSETKLHQWLTRLL